MNDVILLKIQVNKKGAVQTAPTFGYIIPII
jgi:hypothetical protein